MLDIYAGIDTGTNTTFGPLGDNNDAVGGIGGFNLTFLDGNLTILALTHFGPEQPTRLLSPLGFNANGQWRYYNDVIVTWKATEKLTLVSEANLVRDGFGAVNQPANGFGFAQYVSYALTDTVALNGRAEYWRDDHNFFVASFPTNNGPILAQQGFGPPVHVAPGSNTTYGALTFGVTWKPALPAPVTGLLIRPEVRWDHAFTNNHPFNAQRDNNAVTLGAGRRADVLMCECDLYGIYMPRRATRHRIFMAAWPSLCAAQHATPHAARSLLTREHRHA